MNGDTPFDRMVADGLTEPMAPDLAARLDDRIADLIARQAVGQPSRRHLVLPRGKARISVLIAAALLVAVAGTVAAAGLFGASETAPQVDDEMADARAVTPIPPGATWPPMHTRGTIDDPDQPGATISVMYDYPQGHYWVEYTAACMWEGYWLDGYDRSDAAQMATGLAGLEKSRSWIAFLPGSGSGMSSAHKTVVDAAERGDPAPVRKFMKEFVCGSTPSTGSSPSTGS
jgi:hypothetical protein